MKVRFSSLSFILLMAVLMLATLGASLYWGSMANSFGFLGASLEQFDRKTGLEEDSCFIVRLDSQGYQKSQTEIEVLVEDNIALRQTIDLGEESVFQGCVPASLLQNGDNLIELRLDNERLFYHCFKTEQEVKKTTPEISFLGAENESVKIRVQGNDDSSFEPLSLYVNGALDHKVYFKGDAVLEEKVKTREGSNTIKAVFKNASAETSLEKSSGWQSHWLLGVVLLLFVFSVFFFIFSNYSLTERMAFSLAGFFALLGLSSFLLLLSGLASPLNLGITLSAAAVILAVAFRRNFKNSTIKINKVTAFSVVVVLLVVGSAILFDLFTENHVSLWTSYYERQSETLAELQHIPAHDPLSFLGTKPYGYFSLYFTANAAFSWLLNLGNAQHFGLLMLFAKLFVLCSLLALLKRLKLNDDKSFLAVMLFFLTAFVFGDLIFSARHLTALGFMFLGLNFMLDRQAKKSSLLLALATAVQTLVFGLFVLAGVIFAGKKQAKSLLQALVYGGILSLLFYLPFVQAFGWPFQANAGKWGFLFGMPWYGVLVDLLSFIIFFGFFLLPYLARGEIKPKRFDLKLAAAALVLIAVQLLLTYRVNIITALVLSVLSVRLLPDKFLENRFARHALAGIFVFGIAIAAAITMGYSIPGSAMHAFHYVGNNSSSQAHVLNEPALGHATALFAERPITADLAVEYGNETMINDSYAFLENGSQEILDKYKVDFVLNRKNFVETQPVGSPTLDHDLEFESLDKVYTNGFYFVHWNNN